MSTPAGGNPVTGKGYVAPVANDEKGSPSPPAAITSNGTGNTEIRRDRVLPGGYSSGLWWKHKPVTLFFSTLSASSSFVLLHKSFHLFGGLCHSEEKFVKWDDII